MVCVLNTVFHTKCKPKHFRITQNLKNRREKLRAIRQGATDVSGVRSEKRKADDVETHMETSLAGMNCRNKDSCINCDEIRVSVIQCQTKIGSRRRESETRILFETAISQFGRNFGGSF